MWPSNSAPSARNREAASLSRRTFLGQAAAALVLGSSFGITKAYAASPAVEPGRRRVFRAPCRAGSPATCSGTRAGCRPRSGSWGVEGAYRKRWDSLPDEVRDILTDMAIPSWMIALVPMAPSQQAEIMKQFRFMANLSGPPASSKLARRAEQLLIFGGAAQLPTPGDRRSGACLGAEGCTAAMSKYILAQLKIEYPRELARMSDAMVNCQSSSELANLCDQAAREGMRRGGAASVCAAQGRGREAGQPDHRAKAGRHACLRLDARAGGWNWASGDKMAIGNTGLAQYGDRMILAQEYVSAGHGREYRNPHNQHGPINCAA